MRIEFEMDGGLAYMPGLAKPVTIEVNQLPEAEAREIRDQSRPRASSNAPSRPRRRRPGVLIGAATSSPLLRAPNAIS